LKFLRLYRDQEQSKRHQHQATRPVSEYAPSFPQNDIDQLGLLTTFDHF
jgi:hypothetical protein